MKVGIVVPFSWSFWGAVVEHAELQAEALGCDVRLIMSNDLPAQERYAWPDIARRLLTIYESPVERETAVGARVAVPA